MTYQLRTSTMKEKARDYVAAARVLGASTSRILFIHILPNLVAILVTLVPFSVSALILALASLDYLGFGLRIRTPAGGACSMTAWRTSPQAGWSPPPSPPW